jgi:hypothetical protein
MPLADDFEDEIALLDGLLGNAEGVFDEIGGFLEMFVAGVVDAAENTAGIDFLTDFDF